MIELKKKKFPHPKTGELLNWFEYNGATSSYRWETLSVEERESESKKAAERFLDREGNFKMHSKTGYIKHWLLEQDQKYDSSYEEAFFKKCNTLKLYWKNNLKIYIPYLHPVYNEKRYYVPDVLIYSDDTFENIIKIIEVKPSAFITGSKNKGTYAKITEAKINALQKYCEENNIDCGIITEKDLGDYLENKKNN